MKKVLIIIGVILLGSFVLLLLHFLPLIIFLFSVGKVHEQAAKNNPAKTLAAITIPFALSHNLTKEKEYNGAADGFDNATPYFSYTYKGNQAGMPLKEQTKQYLVQNGYILNDGPSPRSELYGENKLGDEVTVSLDAVSDTSPGAITVEFQFTSHECLGCDQPNPADQLAMIMPQFAQQNNVTELQKYGDLYRGCDGHYNGACVVYKYASTQSMNALQAKLKAYLEQRGYQISSYFKTNEKHCNNYGEEDCDQAWADDPNRSAVTYNTGSPIWVLWGKKGDKEVFATISDKTYLNKNAYHTFPVPPGNVVIDIIFTSSKCVSDCETPTPMSDDASGGLLNRFFHK